MNTPTYFQQVPDAWPHQYQEVTTAPERGYKFMATPAFVVHSKLLGTFTKPQPFVVRGMTRDRLLVQKLNDYVEPGSSDQTHAWYAKDTWHEIDMSYTVEGMRFVRIVRKAIGFLKFLIKEVNKADKKAAKIKKDFDDRGERCGICPVCFGDFVVHNNGMVHHGFTRPGVGYIIGDCFGVTDYPPFEISCAGTSAYLAGVLKPVLESRYTALRELDTWERIAVQDGWTGHGRARIAKKKWIARGEAGFDRAVENKKYELEREIKSLIRDIAEYEKKIIEWAPQPWPRKQ